MVHSFVCHRAPMLRRAKETQRGLVALSLLLLFSLFGQPPAKAQNRPAIQWMHGGHSFIVQSVLSPDGKILITEGIYDSTIKIRRTSDGLVLRTIINKPGAANLNALAISPDGTKFVAGSMDGSSATSFTVRVYRISDGARLLSWPVSAQAGALAWSPDGSRIAVCIHDSNDIQIRSALDGSVLKTLTGHTNAIESLSFSPDNTRLASGSDDSTVRLWNTADGSLLHTFTGHTGTVWNVTFSPDNHTLASGGADGNILLWDTTNNQLLHTLANGGTPSSDGVSFSPDGSVLATIGTTSEVQTWNVATGVMLHTATLGPVSTYVAAVTYTPDGTQLLAVGQYPEFTYYNSADLSVARSLPSEYGRELGGVGVTPDSAHVVSAGVLDPYLRIWNTATGALESLISDPGSHTYGALAISPDGATFVASDRGSLRVWRISDGAHLLDIPVPDMGGQSARAVAWSKDGTKLFHPDAHGTITIRSASDGTILGTLPTITADVWNIVVSPDGTLLAASSSDGKITIFRLSDSTVVSTLTDTTLGGASMAFLPDSAKLVSGSANATAILWNVATGVRIRTFSAGITGGTSVAVSPDGQTIGMIAGNSTTTHLLFWRISDGGLFADFTDETLSAGQLAFSPDNARIVYARRDATVVVAANPALSPTQFSLEFSPASLFGGLSATGAITLAQPAQAGGVTFTLSSGSPAANPSTNSLTIPAGATSATFTVNTTPVINTVDVPITAVSGAVTTTTPLTVLAHLPADFNHAGHNDLIFQSISTNAIEIWFTDVLNIVGGAALATTPQAGWQVVGVGDFNHDANSDLVFQNQTTGKVVLWYLLGTTYAGGEGISIQPVAGYKVVGVGDFNGDGKPDLLYQQQGTGQLAIWFMDGATVTGGIAIPQQAPAGYRVVGIGDLDGNGKLDIVFQNQTTNGLIVWLMNGSLFAGQQTVSTLPQAGWQVHAVTDLNGDGKADLVFQNQTTGKLVTWFMDTSFMIGGDQIPLVPFADYKLMGPH